jgi:uncharacterized protein YbbK (DUF523 family)
MPDSIEILHCVQNDKSSSVCRETPPRVGVSACLLGQNTRYDGSNKLDPVIVEIVGAVAQIVPVCPEMEIGMGSPRPPIRLVEGPGGLRARGVDDPAVDVTDALREAGRGQTGLSGFVLKSRSPSCGAGDTDVFSPGGGLVSPVGFGIFARSVMNAEPLLPVEDETALHDRARRNVFLLRVFVYDGWMGIADCGSGAFGAFVEKTDFARNALNGKTGQYLNSLADMARKGGEPEAYGKYTAALLTALRDAPAGGPIQCAADFAVSILSKRKHAAANGGL